MHGAWQNVKGEVAVRDLALSVLPLLPLLTLIPTRVPAFTAFSVAPRLMAGTVQPRPGCGLGCVSVSTTVTPVVADACWPAPSVAVTVMRLLPSGRSRAVP